MTPIRFGLVGSGWRMKFYHRAARARPDLLELVGVVSRSAERAAAVTRDFGVPGFTDLDSLLAAKPLFVVTSVPWNVNPGLLRTLAERGVPALSETPPAPDLPAMLALHEDLTRRKAVVHVAEEYHRRPMQAAQLAVAASGRLGTVTQAQISVGHGYHGISLMRRFLGLKGEACRIVGRTFRSPIVAGPGRDGLPQGETVRDSDQDIVLFEFPGRLGMMDFTGDQYFGFIRHERVLVRGERGELANDTVTVLKDAATPLTFRLIRHQEDLLTGVALRGIQCGDEWVYRNPLEHAGITDDDLAVGDCLLRMADAVRTGAPFYSLAEGLQDHYLYLKMQEALRTRTEVEARAQPWAGWSG